jgi:hypothetical protein
MDKATLIQKLSDNRALFERIVEQVREVDMLRPMGVDQKTGKDTIAHITAWEQRVMHWLNTVAQGELPHSPEPGAAWDDLDRLNAQTLARNKYRSLSEVQTDSQRSFPELLELIQGFSDQQLMTPRPFAWSWQGDTLETGRPLWKSILASPCYAHYQSHLYEFLALLDPAQRFVPDHGILQRYAGCYQNRRIGLLTFRVENNDLLVSLPEENKELTGIMVDGIRIAYDQFGLVTFFPGPDDKAPVCEWWVNRFERVE